MESLSEKNIHEDLFVGFLRSQLSHLQNILSHIEQGNPINGYVDENIKRIEKDLHWLRRFYFNN